MPDYLAITDTELEPGKPALSSQPIRLRDNPLAIAEGAAGAPRVMQSALSIGLSAGQLQCHAVEMSATTNLETYNSGLVTALVNPVGVLVNGAGAIRVSFRLSNAGGGGAAFARVYLNGVPVGIERSSTTEAGAVFVEELSVSGPALVQVWVRRGQAFGGAEVTQGRVLVAQPTHLITSVVTRF